VQETITARYTLTLPFYCSREVSYQSKYILQRRRWGRQRKIVQVPVYLPQELVSFDIRETASGRQLGKLLFRHHMARYTNHSAVRSSYSLSLRQRVRCALPNLYLDALSSIDQGEVRETNEASFSRASSQVMPGLICCVLGYLTQNHNVVSQRSPRINGSQFYSCLGNPVWFCQYTCEQPVVDRSPNKLSPTTYRLSCCRSGRIPGRAMRTLVDEIGCVP